jgi:uncharacterized protein involved in exopolysaccharide biosynthesis
LLLAPVHNVRLISISYTSTDPTEAAKIANAVAEAYSHYRLQSRLQLTTMGLKAMQDQYQYEEKQIQAAQTNVSQLREQFKIQDDTSTNLLPEQLTYWDQKFKLNQLIEQHRLFAVKIYLQKIDAAIPKTSMVQIVDSATPPKFPVGPNRFVGSALFTVGFILALCGIFLFKLEL